MSVRLSVVSAVGDVLDRITILTIKAARLSDAARRVHVDQERAALLVGWASAGLPSIETIPEYTSLIEVNTALWEVEDRLRLAEARQDFGAAFTTDARSVYRLNDRRAALKRAVNERFDSEFWEEKLHPHYEAPPASGPATELAHAALAHTDLTHIDAQGNARMVEVGEKAETRRIATAEGWVRLSATALAQVRARTAKKGDVLMVAQLAGIMGAKRTADLIPLCHPLFIEGVDVQLSATDAGVHIVATARVTGKTGVEMEALTAVSVAALTVYDMLKAVDRGIRIEGIRLIEKSGGRSGHWVAT